MMNDQSDFQRAYFHDQIMELGMIYEGEDRPASGRLVRLAEVWSEFADFEHQAGNDDAAQSCCQSAICILEELIQETPDSIEFRRYCASAYHNLGLLQMDHGHYETSKTSIRKAIDLLREVVLRQPDVPEHSHELAGSINNLGLMDEQIGQPDIAKESFLHATEIWERLVRENPANDEFRKSFLLSRKNIKRFERARRGPRSFRGVGVSLIATSLLLVFGWLGIATSVGPTGPNRNAWAYHLGGWMLSLAAVCLLVGLIVLASEKK